MSAQRDAVHLKKPKFRRARKKETYTARALEKGNDMSLKKAHELTRELTHAPANTCRPQHAHVRPHHSTSNIQMPDPVSHSRSSAEPTSNECGKTMVGSVSSGVAGGVRSGS